MTKNRFVNNTLSELQKDNRSPIFGYEDSLLLTLEEAVEKIKPSISHVMDYVVIAKEKYNQHSSLLTRDESAAIYLYTMPSFFSLLKTAFRAENRRELKPWFDFLKLFMTALEKLPSTKAIVWRGVNYDDRLTYVDNDVHIWWNVNSCSMNPNSVQPFLGESGTLFAIDAIHGKDISTFSAIPDEQEVVLMPATRVRRRHDTLNFIDRLFILHLEEITLESESQSESSYLFEVIKQDYQRHSRIERLMNPAKSFPIEQSYINLAIVNAKEQREKEKQLRDAQHNDAIMSSFEEIYGMKTAIAVKNIFQSCKNQEKQVLVFGRAGTGKSTFCRYVAYQWARGLFWPQYELLALIPLRCLTNNRYPPLPPGQNYSLIDLVKKEVLSYELSEKEERLFKNQFDIKKTLWILDGYDEIVQNVPSHLECVFQQLLKTPHHILTSRPYLNSLSYDVQMEITGFTDKNIKEYVHQFFNQMKDELDNVSTKSATLLKFLQSNRSIWGVAHIPVNLELICSLCSNGDWWEIEQLTITTLYSMMTEWLCRRYLKIQDNQVLQLSEDQINQRCQNELAFLENLAFHAMESNTIIIRPSLLKKAFNQAKVSSEEQLHILNIGVLNSFNQQGTGTGTEMKKDHYFVHLSFQEYFAARYLINALKGSSTEKTIEFIKYQKYNQRYALMFSFAAGLLRDSDAKACLKNFWDNIMGEPLDLVGIRHMQLVISCLEETSGKSTFPRRAESLQSIAKCIQYNVFIGNEPVLEHLSTSLKRAQSVACDQIVTNVLIDCLQDDNKGRKQEVLSFISQLEISNPSAALITSITPSLTDKSEYVRADAAVALGQMGEKVATNEVISKLVSALGDKSESVIARACDALGRMGEKAATNEVISKLVGALGDKSDYVRGSACDALGRMGEKAATNEVISKLVSTLGDKSDYVRRKACDALGKMGEKAATNEVISKLVSALEDDSEDVRWGACYILGMMGEKAATNEVISKLVSALGGKCEYVRGRACETLEQMGGTTATNEVIRKLVSALLDDNKDLRGKACLALGKMGEEAATNEVISKVVSALEDESEYVRGRACLALGKMREKAATVEVISKLVSTLGDNSEYVRRHACLAVGETAKKAATNEVITRLVSAIGDGSEYVRSNACKALEKMGEKAAVNEVISKLVSALEDDNEDVRWGACFVLGKMGEKAATNEVITRLVNALEDESEYARRNACEVLGKIGEKAATNEVISKLVTALGDESPDIRRGVCQALGKMGEKVATNEVISKLVSTLGDESEDVRASACVAVREMGEKAATNEVISKLVSALVDESEDVRVRACGALGKMGEKAATNEVISKLVVLLEDGCNVHFEVSDAMSNILSSSLLITELDPQLISDVCLSDLGWYWVINVSVTELTDMFFTTKNSQWLSVVTHMMLVQEVAVTTTQNKLVMYDREEPLELSVPSLELSHQLMNALTDQSKRLHLFFDILPKV